MSAGIGVYVFDSAGRVLLGRRKNAVGRGEWCVPGGKIEVGESFADAGAREVLEETGIVIRSIDMKIVGLTNDYFPDANQHYITIHAECRKFPGAPSVMEPDRCERWEWFRPEELPSPLFLPNAQFFAGRGYRVR